MSYDPECEKLAEYFLSEGRETVPTGPCAVLAQHIQDAVDDWLRGYRADMARDNPPEAAA